ncbi:hypothetical protein DERP_011344 [Dermatophagoides pteronyssinus]|uniref:Uncharacterized protein n=1 Tax=Dermatophagoides pteronyssinus TaxID=6956 RepID=A0ABQ8J7Y9_DERPT|nr:hypothetical protein DERP_011344 [Dermatophagoides pteronyssinus]
MQFNECAVILFCKNQPPTYDGNASPEKNDWNLCFCSALARENPAIPNIIQSFSFHNIDSISNEKIKIFFCIESKMGKNSCHSSYACKKFYSFHSSILEMTMTRDSFNFFNPIPYYLYTSIYYGN